MKTKESKKKTAVRKTAKKTEVSIDPFDSIAEPVVDATAKKRVAKVVKSDANSMVKKPRVSPAKRAAADPIEPFADIAGESSPVRKSAVRSTKKAIETVEPKAEPVNKAPLKRTTTTLRSKKADLDITAELAAAEPEVELSPVFRELADPVLPELLRENRARLQMQTPTRLYFYWSIRENPYHLLRNAFGDDLGSYTLVLKLIDKKFGYEEIHQADAEGNYWFNVEPDRKYQAEIGFYAPNRPYFRIIYSNIVETPRRSPSPHSAAEAKWTVSANKFAEVLDVAGFTQDAFDVSMAGDDQTAAENITYEAFTRFVGAGDYEVQGIAADEIRYALIALASGLKLDELRWKISPALFAILQTNADEIEASKAMGILSEYFDIDEAEFTEEQFGPAVYGASLVNFPRTLKTRAMSPKFASLSSHSYR